MGRLLEFLKKHGLTAPENAEGFDAEVTALEADLEKPAPKPEPEKPAPKPEPVKSAADTPDDLRAFLKESIQEAVKPINERMDKFEEASKTREEQTRAQEIERILDEAVAKGKIEPDKRDTWKTRLTSAFDPIKETIDGMPENPVLAKQAATKQADAKGKAGDDDKGEKPKNYSTAFARGANPELMKHVEQQLASN